MKKILYISSTLFIMILGIIFFFPKNETRILYSWDLEEIIEDENTFEKVLKEYKINTIYQDFTKEFLDNQDDSFISNITSKNIEIYHLAGDPSWGTKNGFEKIKKEIDLVIQFNQNTIHKLKGIVLDIEPYADEIIEEFELDSFKDYVEEIKKTYSYTQEENLELILAIPYWFDHISTDLLEELIQNTDGISVMNYIPNKTSENIKEEIQYAKKYQKQINTIYEIDKNNEITLKEIEKDYQEIKKENQLKSLGIAYHYYKTMK